MVSVSNNGGSPYNPQPIVDAQPAGTQFDFDPGVHRWTNGIVPKAGDTYNGVGTVSTKQKQFAVSIIDGCYDIPHAFSGTSNNVTIQDLEIRGFAHRYQKAAIFAGNINFSDNLPLAEQGQNWSILRCDIHHALSTGVVLTTGGRLNTCRVHHNGQNGVVALAGDNIIIDNCEVDHNNTDRHSALWEAGNTKFKWTRNLIVRNSYFHHSLGYGIWTDIANHDVLIENCTVTDCARTGIFHEISGPSNIRFNYVARCGFESNSYVFDGGIVNTSSWGFQNIANNRVEDCFNGITVLTQNRPNTGVIANGAAPPAPNSPYVPSNVNVQGNLIINSGMSGYISDYGATFPNVTWDNNNYQSIGPSGSACSTGQDFYHPSGYLDWAGWQGQGRDAGGTFT